MYDKQKMIFKPQRNEGLLSISSRLDSFDFIDGRAINHIFPTSFSNG